MIASLYLLCPEWLQYALCFIQFSLCLHQCSHQLMSGANVSVLQHQERRDYFLFLRHTWWACVTIISAPQCLFTVPCCWYRTRDAGTSFLFDCCACCFTELSMAALKRSKQNKQNKIKNYTSKCRKYFAMVWQLFCANTEKQFDNNQIKHINLSIAYKKSSRNKSK